MEVFVSVVNDVIWSSVFIYLCLGVGLFYFVLICFV